MLGKASQIKSVTIEPYYQNPLHKVLNEWLADNPDVDVISIQYGFALNENEFLQTALIIYKGGEPNAS